MDADAARALQRLGEALAQEGKHEQAGHAFTRAFGANEAAYGVGSVPALDSLSSLGMSLLEQVCLLSCVV